jgi:uncharacterized protein (TIGR02118 family)
MIRVCVSYPNQPGARFDVEYYLSQHMPMVEKRLAPHGMTGWSVEKGVGGFAPGTPPEHLIRARLDLETLEGLQTGMASEGAAILGDIPIFTDIKPQIQIYQVLR